VGAASYTANFRHLSLEWIPVSKKNRTRATIIKPKGGFQMGVRPKVLYIPDAKVEEHTQAIRVIAQTSLCPPCDKDSEFLIRIIVLRRTPSEEKTGARNSRRGDLVNMPGLICDALEGLWWENDEQITEVEMKEFRCQAKDSFHIYAWRKTHDEDGVRALWTGDPDGKGQGNTEEPAD